jgi:hypothetical protein
MVVVDVVPSVENFEKKSFGALLFQLTSESPGMVVVD